MERGIVWSGDDSFSLMTALDQSLFTDVSFVCVDGKRVESHKAVLAAAYPLMEKQDWTGVFKAKPKHLGIILLSCIYSDGIPEQLDIDGAKQLVEWLIQYPKLERLTVQINAFIEANTLKESNCLEPLNELNLMVSPCRVDEMY